MHFNLLILLSPNSVRRKLLTDPRSFYCNNYFVLEVIRTCLGVSSDPMFLWISSNSCPLNLLFVRSQQAEIIIVKRLIQGRNNVTRVRVKPNYVIMVVVKTTPLSTRPLCRLWDISNVNKSFLTPNAYPVISSPCAFRKLQCLHHWPSRDAAL